MKISQMVSFRKIKASDLLFIEKVFRSTREKELESTNWSEQQKHAFVVMQSMAQEADYKKNFPDALFEIILFNKKPAGRVYTNETGNEIQLIDISLLPEYRGKGIGTVILSGLIKRSEDKQIPVTLHVLPDNPALNLYQRMGFKHIGDSGLHWLLERRP